MSSSMRQCASERHEPGEQNTAASPWLAHARATAPGGARAAAASASRNGATENDMSVGSEPTPSASKKPTRFG